MDKATRETHLRLKMAIMDQKSQEEAYREDGRAEGLAEAKRVFAKKALFMGLDLAIIVELTGLALEEIEKLQEGN